MYWLTGIAIAAFVTTLLIAYFARSSSGGDRWGFMLAIRSLVEVVLVVGAVCALVATAVIGSAPAWQLFGAYVGTRVIGLIIEAAVSRY